MERERTESIPWWPAYIPAQVELGTPVIIWRHALSIVAFAVVMSLPIVVRATGISAAAVCGLFGTHLAWSFVSAFALDKKRATSRGAYNATIIGNLIVNEGIVCALPVLSGDPRSPLWMGVVLYACLNGAARYLSPCLAILLTHVFAPLFTIPFFLGQGCERGWSIAAPILASAFGVIGYQYLALNARLWRRVARERDEALEKAQRLQAELDRRRLARDLHDSVGSSLALLGLYGDVIERHAHDPGELSKIAAMVKEAARDGLTDLRAMLEALAPEEVDLEGLAKGLRSLGVRLARASGTEISVESVASTSEPVSVPVRLGLTQVFREATRNAISHGEASNVRVRIESAEEGIHMVVEDDGVGFDAGRPKNGRGLHGMKSRAAELGGTLEVRSAVGSGTRVTFALPRNNP